MMRYLMLTAALAASTPVLAQEETATLDPVEDYRTVSVNAEAEIKSAPDQVEVSLGLSERAPKLETARKAVDEQLKALYGIAKDLKIAEKDLQTTSSSVQPEYDYVKDKQVFKGYQVSHSVTVTLHKLDDLAPFLDKALGAKIDEVNNIEFSLDKQDELREQALEAAMRKARRKADVLAAAAGMKVGQVVDIQEGGAAEPPRPIMMRGKAMMMASHAESSMDAAPPAGEMEVNASVSVTYTLVP